MLCAFDSAGFELAAATRNSRTPTARQHTDPDYSCVYVVVHTDQPDGPSGHGLTFNCGRGTEVGSPQQFTNTALKSLKLNTSTQLMLIHT